MHWRGPCRGNGVGNGRVGRRLPASGTFVLDGGSYSITLGEEGGHLVVVEPNKCSLYTPAGDGGHKFHNDDTGSSFYLRVLDHDTLGAGRIPQSGSPSILKRLDTSAMMAALEGNDG